MTSPEITDAAAKKSGGWNYRIMRHVEQNAANQEVWYAMHEVYYDTNGAVHSWTKDACGSPCGETLEEMVGDLAWIMAGLTKPVLQFEDGREVEAAAILADDLQKWLSEHRSEKIQ